MDVPLTVYVWDFELPATRDLIVTTDCRVSALRDYGEGDTESFRRYLLNMVEHGVNATGTIRPPVRIGQHGAVEIDYKEMDDYVEHCRSIGLVHLPVPIFWVSHGQDHRWPADAAGTVYDVATRRAVRLGLFEGDELNPQSAAIFTSYLQQMVAHFQQKGWYETTWVQYVDEPDLRDPVTVDRVRQIAQLIRRIAPDLPIMQTRPPWPGLFDSADIWMSHAGLWKTSQEMIAAARAAGHVIGVYHNTIPMIDYTPMRTRTFPWGLWTQDVDLVGSWWTLTNWRDNPWENPQVGPGRNGDGILLYPPRDQQEHGPTTSVRWETYRDGLEDYDYLTVLEQLAAQRPGLAGSQELLREARTVMPTFPAVRGSLDEPYWTDAPQLEDLRVRIAEQIVRLQAVR